MLTFPPPPFRYHNGPAKGKALRVAPLKLVSAVYDPGQAVILTFDRPIDIAAMEVGTIHLDDGEISGIRYQGFGAPELGDPMTVIVWLKDISRDPSPGVHLTADAGNGVVARGGGAAWGGVRDLALPFP
jgi:hypothetical protein